MGRFLTTQKQEIEDTLDNIMRCAGSIASLTEDCHYAGQNIVVLEVVDENAVILARHINEMIDDFNKLPKIRVSCGIDNSPYPVANS